MTRAQTRAKSISVGTVLLGIIFGRGCGGGSAGQGLAPKAPTGVTATAGDKQIIITWNAVSGATGYNLYWATNPGVVLNKTSRIGDVTSPYTLKSFSCTPYYFLVTALNSHGESTPSNEASVITLGSLPVPTGLTATGGNREVTLTWSTADQGGATYDNLYWSTTPGVSKSTGTLISSPATPYTHVGLTNGTIYYYVVTAANSACESAESEEVSATPSMMAMKWQFSTGGPIYYSSPAIGPDGTIYVGNGAPFTPSSPMPSLYAINADGTLRWTYAVGVNLHSPALDADGTIYVQDSLSSLYAFAQDGTLKWKYALNNVMDVGQVVPAIASDGTVYVGADGLYAFNPDGSLKWKQDQPDPPIYSGPSIRSGPVIGLDGTIYAGVNGRYSPPGSSSSAGGPALWAVNVDGTMKWNFVLIDAQWIFSSPAIATNGTVYVGAETGTANTDLSFVYAINPDGTLKWRYDLTGGRAIRSSPTIGLDGTIYVGTTASSTANAELLALSAEGTLQWEFGIDAAGADIYCTPTIGAEGTIYFGAGTGYLYALNPDGTLKQGLDIHSAINWTSPAMGSDGTVYIGDNNGDLVAISFGSLGLARTSWPKFHHGNRNNGRSGPWWE